MYIATSKLNNEFDVQGDTKKRELLKTLPNYHCFCKTFLWRKHAVERSTDP